MLLSFSVLPSRQLHVQSYNRNTRTRCQICSKLTIKIPERRHWCRFGIFIGNFEHISHLSPSISIANFEQVNAGWVVSEVGPNWRKISGDKGCVEKDTRENLVYSILKQEGLNKKLLYRTSLIKKSFNNGENILRLWFQTTVVPRNCDNYKCHVQT